MGKTIETFLVQAGRVAMFYIAYLTLKDIKGTDTSIVVDVVLSTLGSKDGVKVSLLLMCVAFFSWAIYERSIRMWKTKYLEDRIRELEKKLDDSRSSGSIGAADGAATKGV